MEMPDLNRQAAEQTELEARIQAAQLRPTDTLWLREIVPPEQQPIMLSWMNGTNMLIRTGAPELPSSSRAPTNGKRVVVEARAQLLDRIGLEEVRVGLQEAGLVTLVSPLNVVPLCRIFHRNHISIRSMASYLDVFRLDPESVEEKIQVFKDNGVDVGVVLSAKPYLLDAPIRKIEPVGRIANSLGWQGPKEELISGGIIRDKLSRTFFLAHLAANHLLSQARSLPLSAVEPRMRYAPESHLLAIIGSESYSFQKARSVNTATAGQNRRELILASLKQPDACRRIGAPTLRAYFRHRPLTDDEKRRHKTVGAYTEERFSRFEDPFLGKDALLLPADDRWIMKVAAAGIVLDADRRARLNDWIRLGSRDARFQKNRGKENPTVKARDAFFAELGWLSLADDHPLKTRITSFLNRQPSGLPPAFIVRAMRFCEVESIDPVQFMVRSPSLAPADMAPYPERAANLRNLFETAGRSGDKTELLNNFVGALAKTAEHLQSLTLITSAYRRKLLRPLSDADIRNIVATTIEAHVLNLTRDNQVDPKYANKYQRTQSLDNLTDQLRAFLRQKGIQDKDHRQAGLALLT